MKFTVRKIEPPQVSNDFIYTVESPKGCSSVAFHKEMLTKAMCNRILNKFYFFYFNLKSEWKKIILVQ